MLPTSPLDALSYPTTTSTTTPPINSAVRARTINCPRARTQTHKTIRARQQQSRRDSRAGGNPSVIVLPRAFDDPDAPLASSTNSLELSELPPGTNGNKPDPYTATSLRTVTTPLSSEPETDQLAIDIEPTATPLPLTPLTIPTSPPPSNVLVPLMTCKPTSLSDACDSALHKQSPDTVLLPTPSPYCSTVSRSSDRTILAVAVLAKIDLPVTTTTLPRCPGATLPSPPPCCCRCALTNPQLPREPSPFDTHEPQ